MKFLAIALAVLTLLKGTPEFEVATIKPTASTGAVQMVCHGIDSKFEPNDAGWRVPLGRCIISSARLSHLMSFAYGVDRIDGPGWTTGGERFDIAAKAVDPSNSTEAQLKTMLQNLLADRFKTKFHRETREAAGFAIKLAEGGPKLRDTKSETKSADYDVESIFPRPLNSPHLWRFEVGARLTLHAKRLSISDLRREMRNEIGGPTVDETGLRGLYDIELKWDAGMSMIGPFRTQLGLQLEPRNILVDFLVIDSAERPDGN